jgi:hypothetical protein
MRTNVFIFFKNIHSKHDARVPLVFKSADYFKLITPHPKPQASTRTKTVMDQMMTSWLVQDVFTLDCLASFKDPTARIRYFIEHAHLDFSWPEQADDVFPWRVRTTGEMMIHTITKVDSFYTAEHPEQSWFEFRIGTTSTGTSQFYGLACYDQQKNTLAIQHAFSFDGVLQKFIVPVDAFKVVTRRTVLLQPSVAIEPVTAAMLADEVLVDDGCTFRSPHENPGGVSIVGVSHKVSFRLDELIDFVREPDTPTPEPPDITLPDAFSARTRGRPCCLGRNKKTGHTRNRMGQIRSVDISDVIIIALAFALGYYTAATSSASNTRTVIKYRFIPRTASETLAMPDDTLWRPGHMERRVRPNRRESSCKNRDNTARVHALGHRPHARGRGQGIQRARPTTALIKAC